MLNIGDLDPTPTIISLGACDGDPLLLSDIPGRPEGTAALGDARGLESNPVLTRMSMCRFFF